MPIRFTFLFLVATCIAICGNAQSYEQQYEKCSESFKNLSGETDSVYTDLVIKRNECLKGAFAPDFTTKTITGKEIELSALRGHVVVLNFWSTTCGPCIEEIPGLNRLVRYYSEKKIAFISFTPNSDTVLKKFFKTHPFNFETIALAGEIQTEKFKLTSFLPYSMIIDKEGKIAEIWFGSMGKKETFGFYKKLIDKLLL